MSRSPFDNCSVGGEQCPLGWKEEAVGGCEILQKTHLDAFPQEAEKRW